MGWLALIDLVRFILTQRGGLRTFPKGYFLREDFLLRSTCAGHAEHNKNFLWSWARRGYRPGEDTYWVFAWRNPQPSVAGRPGPILQTGTSGRGSGRGCYETKKRQVPRLAWGSRKAFSWGLGAGDGVVFQALGASGAKSWRERTWHGGVGVLPSGGVLLEPRLMMGGGARRNCSSWL